MDILGSSRDIHACGGGRRREGDKERRSLHSLHFEEITTSQDNLGKLQGQAKSTVNMIYDNCLLCVRHCVVQSGLDTGVI